MAIAESVAGLIAQATTPAGQPDGNVLYFAVQVATAILGVFLIPITGLRWISRQLWKVGL